MKHSHKTALKRLKQIEKAATPLIKYLNDHHNPHAKIIVHCTGFELLEGVCSNQKIYKHLKD